MERILHKMGSEDFSWRPPTEEEALEHRARRQRSDQISKIMSEYLLKGYRMLATYCPKCMNILLQDKNEKDYCVACEEVDIQPSADQQQHQEKNLQEHQEVLLPTVEKHVGPSASVSAKTDSEYNRTNSTSIQSALENAKSVLMEKLRWATQCLSEERRPSVCVDYADLIKACVQSLTVVDEKLAQRKTV